MSYPPPVNPHGFSMVISNGGPVNCLSRLTGDGPWCRYVFIIIYEDFLAGDQVDDYGSTLLTSGYALSDITNVSEDLKNLGYARYYYEKEVGDSIIYIEVYFVPKIQLDEYSKVFYPNGIFHLRIIKTSKN